MNTLIMYALKTIRYRSLIAEALLGNLSKCEDTKRRSEIITVCHRSADVLIVKKLKCLWQKQGVSNESIHCRKTKCCESHR